MEKEMQKIRAFKEVRIAIPWGFLAGKWYEPYDVRPIVALHGIMDNSGTFDTLIPLMLPEIGILCIDMPGHGNSSHFPAGKFYDGSDYLHAILLIMKEYKWQKISLLGHSMSSAFGFLFCGLFPDKVDLMVALDTAMPEAISMRKALSEKKSAFENFIKNENHNLTTSEPPSYSFKELIELMFKGIGGSVDREHCKYILERNVTSSKKFPEKYYFSRDRSLKNVIRFYFSLEILSEFAKKISIPYLFIQYRQSPFYLDRQTEQFLGFMKKNKNFEFYETDGKHHGHMNCPGPTSKIINEFIRKIRTEKSKL